MTLETNAATRILASTASAVVSRLRDSVAGALARAPWSRPAAPAEPFITISNGRCGTTWLATSLASLGDVDVDHEVKWRPHYAPQPVHLVLDSPEDRLVDKLRALSRGGRLVGSKFVLDPYMPFLRCDLDDLLATIDPATKVVHITRNYFDMLKSFEARGAVNRLADGAAGAGRLQGNQLLASLERETRGGASTHGGFCNKPAATLAKALLIYFINDMVCAKVCAHVGAANWIRVSYESMARDFGAVISFLGSQADEAEIARIMANPVTKKLEALDDNYLPHFKLLRQLARELDAVRDAVISGQWDVDATWRDENPPLHLPQKVGMLLSMISALDVPTDIGLGKKLKAALGF